MRYALMIEPQQGMRYADILAVAQLAEKSGFEALFRSDHYTSFPGETGLPTTDAWATLAGLARETSTIRLGTLVSPMTFRVPGNLAKVVATVNEMAGGRIECGLGAGWNEQEHGELGIPYPEDKVRVDLLEETLQLFHGLWEEPDGWTMDGKHIKVTGSLFRPKEARPPILVGGLGRPRSVRLAATYADEHNLSSATPEQVREVNAKLDAACEKVGRDPSTLVRSAMTGVLIGRDEADLALRTAEQLRTFGTDASESETWLEARRDRWAMGLPDQARERVALLEDAGIERVMLQVFLPFDLEHIALIGETFLG
jgi:F420-dependent oxidoreductase-like protein